MSLRCTVLALLSEQPNTGYGIGRLLEHQLSHLWGARLQQIYRELSKLEAQNFVEAEHIALLNRPAKKIYTITPAGSKALDRWLNEPPAPLVSKSDMLLKVYCLERLPKDVIVRRLEERQAEYETAVHDLREKLTGGPPGGPIGLPAHAGSRPRRGERPGIVVRESRGAHPRGSGYRLPSPTAIPHGYARSQSVIAAKLARSQ